MNRTKEVIEKEIAELKAELKALPKPFTADDVVPGAQFKSKYDTTLFIVMDHQGQYLVSGLSNNNPCTMYSDAPRSLGELLQYLNSTTNKYKKVPGVVKFVESPAAGKTKNGDVLDGLRAFEGDTRTVEVKSSGAVVLRDANGAQCNEFNSLASLNEQLDDGFSFAGKSYRRRN